MEEEEGGASSSFPFLLAIFPGYIGVGGAMQSIFKKDEKEATRLLFFPPLAGVFSPLAFEGKGSPPHARVSARASLRGSVGPLSWKEATLPGGQ